MTQKHEFMQRPGCICHDDLFNQSGCVEWVSVDQPLAFYPMPQADQVCQCRTRHLVLYEKLQWCTLSFLADSLQAYGLVSEPSARSGLLFWHHTQTRMLTVTTSAGAHDTIFHLVLEYLYHALLIGSLQSEAFQQWKILLSQVSTIGNGERVEQLYEIMRHVARHYCLQTTSMLAIKYVEHIFENSIEIKEVAAQAILLLDSGLFYQQQERLPEAARQYEQALALGVYTADAELTVLALHVLGSFYRENGEPEKALDYFERAFAACKQCKNGSTLAYCLNDLGATHHALQNNILAQKYYEQSLAYWEEQEQTDEVIQVLLKIGEICQHQQQHEFALAYYERALTAAQHVDDYPALLSLYDNSVDSTTGVGKSNCLLK